MMNSNISNLPMKEKVELFRKLDMERLYLSNSIPQWVTDIMSGPVDDLNLFKKYLFEKPKKQKNYFYMLTFTCRDIPTSEGETAIEKYIIKQLTTRPSLKILESWIVKEYGEENGRVHWHCPVKTAKCLKKDRFNYYVKKYGSIDFSKTKAQTIEEGINYISKKGTPKQLV